MSNRLLSVKPVKNGKKASIRAELRLSYHHAVLIHRVLQSMSAVRDYSNLLILRTAGGSPITNGQEA